LATSRALGSARGKIERGLGHRREATTVHRSVTLFKAADLSFIANVPTGTKSDPSGVCSDGINFWITLLGSVGQRVRF
jgi:hypothetical protein